VTEEEVPYDSRPDTYDHMAHVQALLDKMVTELFRRAREHDRSKLSEPEKSVFDRVTPKLASLTYASDEYKASLAEMGEALQHHYAVNDHHPEHFTDGIAGMNLPQLVEMLCDWKAATLRHADGDLRLSIEQNQARFGYSDELKQILLNTAEWIER
jgi:hypothetical protein